MTAHAAPSPVAPDDVGTGLGDDQLSPLPGEPGLPEVESAPALALSKKGLFALFLLLVTLIAASALGIQRFSASARKAADLENTRNGDKPSAATVEPRRLDLDRPPAGSASGVAPRIPALVPAPGELAEPIEVRRLGGGSTTGRPAVAPEDAPILLVSSRPGAAMVGAPGRGAGGAALAPEADTYDPLAETTSNLEAYQRRLQGLLDTLARTADPPGAGPMASGAPIAAPIGASPSALPGALTAADRAPDGSTDRGLFGGQLQGSATPRVAAGMLGNRSLTLAKGTAFSCALKTRLISAASGLVGCQVQRHVFSDDGRTLLIERGSHLDGEYRMASVRPGMVRIPVLWTRIRTPLGVTVDIESPASGQLGESGIDGHVDNRWPERIGAAMLLSLIDDSVKLVIENQASSAASDRRADTIVLPSTTTNTGKLAEKVLDSTINIPPLLYRNQGGIVGIYVARDVDFSSVYELVPTAAHAGHAGRP